MEYEYDDDNDEDDDDDRDDADDAWVVFLEPNLGKMHEKILIFEFLFLLVLDFLE